MKTPFFSIIIPLYNKEGYVGDTLESVRTQQYDDYEVVVVDDGSTDGGAALVESYAAKDPRIRLITQANGGVSVARNRGMSEANGTYYAFLDADDSWAPEHLTELKALAEAYPEAGMLGTAYQRCFNSGPSASLVLAHLEGQRGLVDDYFKYVAQAQFIYTSSIAVAAWAMKDVSGFPEGVRNGEDLDLWTRLALRWPVAYSGKVTVNYACGVVGQATNSDENYSAYYPKKLCELLDVPDLLASRKDINEIIECLILAVSGRFFLSRPFNKSAWMVFIQDCGFLSIGKSWKVRLLCKFPFPLVWRLYFQWRRFWVSRKCLNLFGGSIVRGGIRLRISRNK